MGRKLMRVPMDFDYPLNRTWKGYLNPFYKKCPECENGRTAAKERLCDLVRLLMLSGSDSVEGKNHPYFEIMQQCVYGFNSIPGKDMAELTTGLCGRSPDRFGGHDSSDNWTAEDKIIKAAGLDPNVWGICKHCEGEAIDPKVKKQYDEWESYEPPTGEGYQLWETTSEGSPQSPVFKTLDELCSWCEKNATTFGSFKTSKEKWKEMLSDDFVFHKEGNAIFL